MGGDFSRFSILREVEDLKSAFQYFLGTGIKSVHLIGSSMGGVVALLFASMGFRPLRSLSLIATPVKLDELSRALAGGIDPSILPAEGMSLIDGVPVHNAFFRETASIDMKKAIGNIGVPVLVLHGGNDSVVDISNARLLDEMLGPGHALVIITDGEHNLTRESDITILGENIIGWMKEHAT
jgi:pimeloyl-ACP methyl ester carboxylesterase